MKTGLAACILGLLLATAPGSVGARPQEMAAEGRCAVSVSMGPVHGGNRCRKVAFKPSKSGGVLLEFEFPDGLTLQFEGPALRISDDFMMMSPERMSWTNPGGDRQHLENLPDSPKDELTGRCGFVMVSEGTQLSQVHCNLRAAVGEIRIEFKAGAD